MKYLKEVLIYTGIVFFCAIILIFLQEICGVDLFEPLVITYKL